MVEFVDIDIDIDIDSFEMVSVLVVLPARELPDLGTELYQ